MVVSFHVKESAAQREVPCTESGWPFIRFQLADYFTHLFIQMLGTTNKLSNYAVRVLWLWFNKCTLERILFLGLAVTEINNKKV